MRQGDNGPLAAATDAQGLEFVLQATPCPGGRLGKLAQQTTQPGIALADTSGFFLAGRFVVTWTQTDPRGQPLGTDVV